MRSEETSQGKKRCAAALLVSSLLSGACSAPTSLLTPLLLSVLTACGFHPAGTRPMPDLLQRVHIDLIAPYRVSEPAVETTLRTLLTRRGAEVIDNIKPDVTAIRLSDLEERRQVLSVGLDGKALEYQLITSITAEVRRGDWVLLPPDTLSVTREYSFNAEEILAKEAEEDRLREFLQNELADLLMLRIEAAVRKAVPPAAPVDAAPAVPSNPGD